MGEFKGMRFKEIVRVYIRLVLLICMFTFGNIFAKETVAGSAKITSKNVTAVLCGNKKLSQNDRQLKDSIAGLLNYSGVSKLPKPLAAGSVVFYKDTKISLEKCSPRGQNVDKTINSIRKILLLIEQEKELNTRVREAEMWFSSMKNLRFDRKQWPDSPECSICTTFWDHLDSVINGTLIDSNSRKHTKRKSVSGIESSIKNLQSTLDHVCLWLSKTLDFNLSKIESDFLYYTWTETFQSIQKLQKSVKIIQKKCCVPHDA